MPSVFLKSTGKTATFTTGSAKWLKILGIANQKLRQWARENGTDWEVLYSPNQVIGTVTATDSFAIDTSTIRNFSNSDVDPVRIYHTDGVGYTDYTIVNADTLKEYYTGPNKEYPIGNYCARIGNNLVFNHKFKSTDIQYGGSIKAPVYLFPDSLVNDSDDIPCDENWLILATAAEYIRTDITRQNMYPTLVAEANDAMQRQKDDNEGQLDEIARPWRPSEASWL